MDYIEEHLCEELTLQELARLAGFSDFHFHRVFQAMAGVPVMDYVRKRRLVMAAFRIAHTDDKLIEIALDCGFGSPETFIRAFRKLFGMTPGDYRKRGIHAPAYGKAELQRKRIHSYLGGIRMNYRIEVKPAFHILGYSLTTRSDNGQNNREIPAFWQRYMQEELGKTLMDQAVSTAEYGICTDHNLDTGDFAYVIGVECKPDAKPPEGAAVRSFPEQTYAVFTTPRVPAEQFTASIQETWNSIYSEWLPHSGYELAQAADFEYYDERCWRDRNEQLEMDIYVPVVPPKKETAAN